MFRSVFRISTADRLISSNLIPKTKFDSGYLVTNEFFDRNDKTISISAAGYGVTGQINLLANRNLSLTGEYTTTGQVDLLAGRNISLSGGYVIDGSIGVKVDRNISVTGSYIATGQIDLKKCWILSLNGAYVVTGSDFILTKSASSSLQIDAGDYSITGSISFAYGRAVNLSGSYTTTGQVNLKADRRIALNGAYNYEGIINLLYGRSVLLSGSYSHTGQIDFSRGYVIGLSGAYQIEGSELRGGIQFVKVSPVVTEVAKDSEVIESKTQMGQITTNVVL